MKHRKPIVLIVDDDVAFAESNRDLLEAYGYQVHVAHTGSEGLSVAREIHPDVMILDVMMATDTEGFEIARKIPESVELAGMGVLLVTGVTTALHLPGTLKPDDTWLPVDRILDKPIAPARLIAEVDRLLASRGRKSA